jgi:hypothetical protein
MMASSASPMQSITGNKNEHSLILTPCPLNWTQISVIILTLDRRARVDLYFPHAYKLLVPRPSTDPIRDSGNRGPMHDRLPGAKNGWPVLAPHAIRKSTLQFGGSTNHQNPS